MAAAAPAGAGVRYALRAALCLVVATVPLAAQTHVIVVTGASGEAKYAASFHAAGSALVDALVTKHGLAPDDVTYLAEDPARDTARIDGKSSKVEVTRTIAGVASRARAGDRLLLVLIGHGSHAGSDSRFNLPGPDVTAAELGVMLEPLGAMQVAVVNAASASGDFLPVLSAKNRVVITATKSSYERNETLFPRYFVAAFTTPGADTDKDERVSLLEAFVYAKREVARAYETDTRLPTEHAMLDDDGDRRGSPEPDPRTGDGSLARRFIVSGGRSASSVATSGSAASELVAKKTRLEAQVDSLRRRKGTMAAEAYERELERLLVDLARVSQDIRQGRSP
jgi:outer membrane murein-binding lipoprotein Lpp